jgi:hypothetical protein
MELCNIINKEMKSIINKLLGRTNNVQPISDLTPRGIRSTIKSKNHGSVEDYNNTWRHIVSQNRNFDLFEKEHGIKLK